MKKSTVFLLVFLFSVFAVISCRQEIIKDNVIITKGTSKIIFYDNVYGDNKAVKIVYNMNKGDTYEHEVVPTREGDYVFDGWYTEQVGGEKIEKFTLTDNTDLVLYAHWTNLVFEMEGVPYVNDDGITGCRFKLKDGVSLGEKCILPSDLDGIPVIDYPEDEARMNALKAALSNVKTLVFPNLITYIPDYFASSKSNLTEIVLGNSMKSLGQSAFSNTKISLIEFPSSVTEIGDSCFYTSASSVKVIYHGTAEQWKEINFAGRFGGSVSATLYCISDSGEIRSYSLNMTRPTTI